MENVAEAGILIQANTRYEDMQPLLENVTVVTGGHYTHREEIKCRRFERVAREKGAKLIHYYINENMQLFKITYAPLNDGENVISAIDLLKHQNNDILCRLPDVVFEGPHKKPKPLAN